jgi:rod shape-determining protein MreC
VIHSFKLGAVGLWQNYIDLRHVRQQNLDLQQTVDRLRLEQAALLEDARQGQRLQGLLAFQEKYIYKTLAAQAIGSSGSDQSRVFYLDKGSADGLDRDMAVITADGIVGKVRDVFPHSAQVLAINDQTSGAGVILETTRIRGILRGNATGQPQIVHISADRRIQPGEKVLTSGGDMIFPRGLPVGVVAKVDRDPDNDALINVTVKPAAYLDRLDEVLVITSTLPRFSPDQEQDLAASEALKGAEAAAILDQKKASAIMAERLPGLTGPNAPAPGQPANSAQSTAPGTSAALSGQAQNQSNSAVPPVAPTPLPAPKLIRPQHPDRFSPGAAPQPDADSDTGANPHSAQKKISSAPAGAGGQSPAKTVPPATTPQDAEPHQTEPRRNP